MPIYEFYCQPCNTVYQFFSKRVDPDKIPTCPKIEGHGDLVRQMSSFAMGRSGGMKESDNGPVGEDGPMNGSNMDNPRVEAEMMDLMSKMETMDENDPKAMGRMMRRLTEITGEGGNDPAMQEAIRRLEGGEDPERVEELVGDAFGEPGGMGGGGGGPSFDSGMYDL